MRIAIRDIIQSGSAITADLGKKVREVYGDRWKTEPIEMDFADVVSVSPSFLSQATKPIIEAYASPEVTHHLIAINAPEAFETVWNVVMRSATARRAM